VGRVEEAVSRVHAVGLNFNPTNRSAVFGRFHKVGQVF